MNAATLLCFRKEKVVAMSVHWQFGAEWGANKVWRGYTEEYNFIWMKGSLANLIKTILKISFIKLYIVSSEKDVIKENGE